MRHVPLALALVLLPLAGCNGIVPGIDGGEMPPVTPAEVPRDMYGGTIAPGLTEQRVVNASALLRAHREVLAGRSVTVASRSTYREGGRVVWDRRTTFRHSADGKRVEIVVRDPADPEGGYLTRIWSNGSVTVFDERRDGRSSVRVDRSGDRFDPRMHLAGLGHAFAEGTVVSVRGLDTGGTYDVFEVTVARELAGLPGERSSTTFVVDERGFIRRFTETDRESDGRDGRRTVRRRTVRYERVGATEVGRPAWVADALGRVASREYVAPGVTSERVVDPDALRGAHRRALRNVSVTYEYERTRRAENGTVLVRYAGTTWVGANGRNYYRIEEQYDDERRGRDERWSNGTVTYVRRVGVDGEPRYDRLGATDHRARSPSFSRSIVFAEETTVTALGDGRYRVVATGIPIDGRRYGDEGRAEVHDGRVEFVVREDGFVEEYVETYVRVEGERTVRHRETFRYVNRGTTDVPRPAWLEEAANETDWQVVADR
ncbi:hypothetical protein [Halomarina pelagica]|uniref:hypothetical protein n=1 Tax=Halomarina pelagica TaxID=2961599 RepID=UPI0020C4426E|nr:hypothetical protein [Halomarina sp. BND7]